MDVHEILKVKLREDFGIRIKDYCYGANTDNPKTITVDIEKEDYDKIIKATQIVAHEFVFKKKLETVERKECLEVEYSYTLKEGLDLSSEIDTGFKLYGVISPEGHFYACGYTGHNNLEYWLKERGLIGESPVYNTDSFEGYGWLKLTGSYMTECEFVFSEKLTKYNFDTKEDEILKEFKITAQQVEMIQKYIKSLGREYVNFNYHWYHIDSFPAILECEDIFEFMVEYQIDLENSRDELEKES